MKISRKLFILTLSFILILSLTIGCSSSDRSSNEMAWDSASGGTDGGSSPMEPPMGDRDVASEKSGLEPEKVITTINLEFETTEFDKTTEDLMDLIGKYKAYVENSNISYNQYYNNKSYKYAQFVIRVPKDDVLSFKTELNSIGNMISENTNKEDVTKQYRDTESRLRVVTTKEERLLALLEKAEKIEDIIALENQLSEVIYEKENLQSSLITIDDKVDFSTVRINIQEVERLRNAETVETTFGTKIKNAFSNSLFAFKNSMENFTIAFIYALPFIIVLAIVIFVVYLIIKRINGIRIKKKKIDE